MIKHRIYRKPVFYESKLSAIKEFLGSIDKDDFEGDLDALINKLQNFKDDNPKWEKYTVEERENDENWSLNGIDIYGEKPESDEEYQKRKDDFELALKMWEEQEKEDERLREKKEKEDYLRLKKKFENG